MLMEEPSEAFAKGPAVKRGEWISVKDRLPETIGHYLVYIKKEYTLCDVTALVFYGSSGKWSGENEYYNNVTHWQPLPPPPKGVI